MKKLSNEIKVGVTALLTIVVFIWLYNFLKGKDLLNSTAYYYSVYDEIGGLAESSPVEVNGYKVGVVQSIKFIDAVSGRLLVSLSVDKNFKLPVNTVAEIVPVSLLGGMKVQFVYGDGPGYYSAGDTIPGMLAVSIIDKMETELLPVKDKITDLLVVLDSVISSINEVMDDEFKNNMNGTLSNLKSTTGSFKEIIGSREEELKSTIANIDMFTKMLSENSENMSRTFSNLKSISDSLSAADINGTITNLKNSLEKTVLLMNDLNNGEGSAGQFLKNDTLYVNLANSLESLNELLQDMKANPKRYVHFSIFGKKSIPSN
jgi:phospholipid/cholesterol/gamma-HCH transport system substrate-binding protein